jgi:SAM-dependent methyltransferase
MPWLTHEQARAFYDDFGSKQDLQSLYEDAALDELLANAELRTARSVVEFGCGTGRLAARMLDGLLPAGAVYFGYDVSETMVGLARERLARFGARARVNRSDGSPALPLAAGDCDRFVSTYVLDLLSPDDARALVAEARRLLANDGRLCLASLAPGTRPFSRAVQAIWQLAWRIRPQLVGGCRPVELRELIGPRWRILHRNIICRLGLCSEVLVVAPPADGFSTR